MESSFSLNMASPQILGYRGGKGGLSRSFDGPLKAVT